jgi:dihydroorotase
MKILLQQAIIADSSSSHNGATRDILIENGSISKISANIPVPAGAEIFSAEGLVVSPGFVDPFAHFCDPGFESRETIETGAAAAAAGGYTRVLVIPNTKPVVDTKTQVEYIRQRAMATAVDIHPLGAITRGLEGKDLAEMYDMHQSGAAAFSDGLYTVQSPGLMLKALQYVKAFDGVLVQLPVDKSIAAGGLIHEGIISTRLGLPGLPALAEELIIKRDIDLLRYTGSRLHITAVSTANSIALIDAAKKEGLSITCSVTPYHLFFCDEDLQTYDTNLKVNPPLRSKADMMALREAVLNGQVDCIATHHIPNDWDGKTCEFEYAKNGMTGLETAFAVVNHLLPELSNAQLSNLFSGNARKIFHLPPTHVEEGQTAELCLFTRTNTTCLKAGTTRSKSSHTAFLERELMGSILGTVHKGRFTKNQH